MPSQCASRALGQSTIGSVLLRYSFPLAADKRGVKATSRLARKVRNDLLDAKPEHNEKCAAQESFCQEADLSKLPSQTIVGH
jgi:hypothetical protein